MREEKGGSQPRREKFPLPLRNPKLCILPFFWLIVQQTCKAKHFFLVARTRKTLDFKNCEIYFTFYFQFIWWICLFFYVYFSYDCLFQLLERTLSYYCRQSIAKFDIKTGVVVYELVKQLSLIIIADLRY
jgi:hypothetical protein